MRQGDYVLYVYIFYLRWTYSLLGMFLETKFRDTVRGIEVKQ